ncbi:hypothetical protein R3P38DRAFT_2800188 [Favolaschia claudopus]|uniref:Uncharacterized protein n=1 Tax=Favolaschia claudopus TaxID=2862362 RepID=A0AAV9ZZE3_9AGAR
MDPTAAHGTTQHIAGISGSESMHVDGLSGNEKLENDADTIKAQDWFTRIANSLSIASPDNWDIIPGAAGVPTGPQNQGSDVEDSGRKGAGIDDSAAKFRRAHGKRGKRYFVDNSGGKCLRDEVKFGPNARVQKTITAFDTFETTVGGRILKRPVTHSLSSII